MMNDDEKSKEASLPVIADPPGLGPRRELSDNGVCLGADWGRAVRPLQETFTVRLPITSAAEGEAAASELWRSLNEHLGVLTIDPKLTIGVQPGRGGGRNRRLRLDWERAGNQSRFFIVDVMQTTSLDTVNIRIEHFAAFVEKGLTKTATTIYIGTAIASLAPLCIWAIAIGNPEPLVFTPGAFMVFVGILNLREYRYTFNTLFPVDMTQSHKMFMARLRQAIHQSLREVGVREDQVERTATEANGNSQ